MDHLGLDLAIADSLYALNNDSWRWRDNFYTAVVIHEWGKQLSVAMVAATLGGLLLSYANSTWKKWRKPLVYLFTSVAVATLLISLLKQLTHVDCPWSLSRYGGDLAYISLWHSRPPEMPAAACFPAGHASAGYAWVALYFFLHYTQSRWRRWGLAIGLTLGLVFGIGQQLRGAHFLSHDLWTLMICWSISALIAHLMFGNHDFSAESITPPLPAEITASVKVN